MIIIMSYDYSNYGYSNGFLLALTTFNGFTFPSRSVLNDFLSFLSSSLPLVHFVVGKASPRR